MKQKGFSVIEIILAAGIFVIFAGGAITVVLQGIDSNRLGLEFSQANQYAAEGIEAAKSIKNQAYANLVNSAGTGVTQSGGVWTFSGTNNTFDKYTRVIKVESVNRDATPPSGNIVASGGTLDPNTKKITSTVTWNFTPVRPESISLITYLSDWRKAIIGDWSNPSKEANINFSGSNDAVDIAMKDNYIFLIRTGVNPNFIVINTSNPASPTQVASLNLASNPTAITISGNYAYVASSSDTTELQIVNITNPVTPVLAGSFNAGSTQDGRAIFVRGSTAYLGRINGDSEFIAINVSNPASPSQLGTLNLNGNPNEIYISGNYAFIANSDNSQEMQIVNVSNPSSLSLSTSMNLSGNSDALSINGFTNTVLVGRSGGELLVINVTTPTSPSQTSTFNTQGNVNGISFGNNNTYAFLATSWGSGEFRVMNISSLASPASLGVLNLNNILTGIVYSPDLDRAFGSSSDNTDEFVVIKPQ